MDISSNIKTFADYIVSKILENYEIEVEKIDDIYHVIIKTEDEASTIIGRHGETIRSFQKILEVMLYKDIGESVKILVDVNDYRAKQRERLEYIGEQHAKKVSETSAPAYLRGFSSYERKIIHEYITSSYPELTTYSLGDGKDRRLVVTLKSDEDSPVVVDSEE
ncbi:MAG: protein jag [Patescibacteria group bacterium]